MKRWTTRKGIRTRSRIVNCLYCGKPIRKYNSTMRNHNFCSTRCYGKWKTMSQKKYMFGDFDKDRVKNIDDPQPFNPKVKKYPPAKSAYYHKARFGGQAVKMSKSLKGVEGRNNQKIKIFKKLQRTHPKMSWRIKTVPSTIDKITREHHHELGDVGGGRVLATNNKEILKQVKRTKKKHKTVKKLEDDFYKTGPKGGIYYAHHLSVGKPKNNVELQIKTEKQQKINDVSHALYKKGSLNKQEKAQLKVLKKKAQLLARRERKG